MRRPAAPVSSGNCTSDINGVRLLTPLPSIQKRKGGLLCSLPHENPHTTSTATLSGDVIEECSAALPYAPVTCTGEEPCVSM